MNRKSAKVLTANITGHEDLRRLRQIHDSTYRYCEWKGETLYHILCDCIATSSKRVRIMIKQLHEILCKTSTCFFNVLKHFCMKRVGGTEMMLCMSKILLIFILNFIFIFSTSAIIQFASWPNSW